MELILAAVALGGAVLEDPNADLRAIPDDLLLIGSRYFLENSHQGDARSSGLAAIGWLSVDTSTLKAPLPAMVQVFADNAMRVSRLSEARSQETLVQAQLPSLSAEVVDPYRARTFVLRPNVDSDAGMTVEVQDPGIKVLRPVLSTYSGAPFDGAYRLVADGRGGTIAASEDVAMGLLGAMGLDDLRAAALTVSAGRPVGFHAVVVEAKAALDAGAEQVVLDGDKIADWTLRAAEAFQETMMPGNNASPLPPVALDDVRAPGNLGL